MFEDLLTLGAISAAQGKFRRMLVSLDGQRFQFTASKGSHLVEVVFQVLT